MREADLDEVAGIEARAYAFPWSRRNLSDSLAAGYEASIFERDGALCAYAIVMRLPDEEHLLNLTVDVPYWGQGIGRAVLARLCERACARGSGGILLEVRPSNEAACQLYARAGFVRIGTRRGYYPAAGQRREDATVLFWRCP